MAAYEASFLYFGLYTEGQYVPVGFGGEFRFVFDHAGDRFSPGDIVTVDGEPAARYIGFSPTGIVLQELDERGLYFYYSKVLLEEGAIPINTTDPLVYCFLAETRIATPGGAVAVQDLAIGDLVLTAGGRSVPVRWLGRQTVVTAFGPDAARRPVRIMAGALGPDLPVADLRITADHALAIDGVLVQAGALVNGVTVRRMTEEELGERFTVFHIETEHHALVLAEGVPAETFIDNVARRCFDNYAEFASLYGDGLPSIAEMPMPRVKSARQLPQPIRHRLATRAAALGERHARAA
jgi:hypothetical protein